MVDLRTDQPRQPERVIWDDDLSLAPPSRRARNAAYPYPYAPPVPLSAWAREVVAVLIVAAIIAILVLL